MSTSHQRLTAQCVSSYPQTTFPCLSIIQVSLANPGEYVARLKYYDGSETTALWTVRDYSPKKKAKNVILFIGDGMTQSMITAARLIAHKSINGKYQTLMQMDQMEALGQYVHLSSDVCLNDSHGLVAK